MGSCGSGHPNFSASAESRTPDAGDLIPGLLIDFVSRADVVLGVSILLLSSTPEPILRGKGDRAKPAQPDNRLSKSYNLSDLMLKVLTK